MSGSMLPRRYRVTENRRETADTRTLSLAPLDAPIPRFRSGQFTMVYLFGVGEIPLSISGCPRRRSTFTGTRTRDGPPTAPRCCGPSIGSRWILAPAGRMTRTGAALTELGMHPADILVSLERNMRCGIGVCGHCQLGPDFVCLDGAVTTLDHAEPLLAVREL
jgi:NAD(P)H-flavin reductase